MKTTKTIHSVYADGGIIGKNPSAIGGTWAYVYVAEDGEIIERMSGVVTPEDIRLPAVTNIVTELLACLHAIENLPSGWSGELSTDSWATVCRLRNAKAGKAGLTEELIGRLAGARFRVGSGFTVRHLDGHPTKAQLAKGIGKRGNPCSKYNVECDRLCGAAGEAYRGQLVKA